MWLDGVIPLAMKSVSDDVKSFEFLIADLDTRRIGTAILHSSDGQPFFGGGVGDQFNNRFQRGQRLGTPVDGDVGKESVFDLVPLAGSWRKMTHRDDETGLVGQLLHLAFP